MLLVPLFVVFFGFHQAVCRTESTFSSWKEPPIDSGIGVGNASVIVRENTKIGNNTGIKLHAIGGKGKITYIFERTLKTLEIGGTNTDEIFIADQIDYEQMDRITISVIAFDEGTPQKTGTATMTVFIGDVNDNPPIFQQGAYESEISPLYEIGKPFSKTHAVDSDGSSPNNKVTYSIAGGNTNNTFMINHESGEIATVQQLVGYNIIPQYELIVIGVDGGSDPGALTGTTTVIVKISDIETFSIWKQPPINSGFGSGTATKKVSENTKLGTTTDIELQAVGGTGNIVYKIIDGQQIFSIGGQNNNKIIVTGPVDFEVNSYISILVEAEDKSSTSKIGRANMTIWIEDINDNAPAFKESKYNLDVSEENPIGHVLANIIAVDDDGTSPNNDITYRLSDRDVNNEFNIDPKTGQLRIAKDLRGESKAIYNIQVLAVDGGITPGKMTGSTMVTINVDRDVDDVTSAGESTTQVTTPMLAGTSILTPCLFTFFIQGTLLTLY